MLRNVSNVCFFKIVGNVWQNPESFKYRVVLEYGQSCNVLIVECIAGMLLLRNPRSALDCMVICGCILCGGSRPATSLLLGICCFLYSHKIVQEK